MCRVRPSAHTTFQTTRTVTWYRDGKVIQVDEGSFEHGRHHGRFKHTLESRNVVYSNWEHGEEVADTPTPNENTDSKGQYVGTYNSGMKAYIVPGTLKLSSDRNSCNVRIVAEGNSGDISYLDYQCTICGLKSRINSNSSVLIDKDVLGDGHTHNWRYIGNR